jgi:cell division protease FtsH
MIVFGLNKASGSDTVLTINQVANEVEKGNISKITVEEDKLTILLKDGLTEKTSTKESNSTLVDQLLALGVTPTQLSPDNGNSIEVKPPSQRASILNALFYFFLSWFWHRLLFHFRQAQGSNNAAMAYGKSRARMFSGDHPTVTFADVAGVDESKEELKEVVEFLREPQNSSLWELVIPKGYFW